jgi:maltose/maltodextrin transport system substrate-binding protein
MKRALFALALWLSGSPVFAWTNGELLIWMDADRGRAIEHVIKQFEERYGVKVRIESPEDIAANFTIAAQSGKGPDIVMWAHDRVGEWAESGIIYPIDVSDEFRNRFLPKGWEGVTYKQRIWGYPIGLETVTLVYNKKLVDGPLPTRLSELETLNAKIKKERPGITSILWDYKSPYYSWGILASAGAYIFAKYEGDYDIKNVGVANPGAVKALAKITGLVESGVLPRSVSYSVAEDLMGQGKLAMMISGPWCWRNLTRNGIDFGVAPIPGVEGNPGKPLVGVVAAYINRSTPNKDLAKEFIQNFLLSEDGLRGLDNGKAIGIPSLISLYEEVAKQNDLIRQMKSCSDAGEVMPNIPRMSRFWTSVGNALQIVTSGKASPQTALKEAESTMRAP